MKALLIMLISLSVLSCNSNEEDQTLRPVTSVLIGQDNLYGAGAEGINQQNLVISDQNTWQNLMAQMNSVNPVTDSFTETDINFSDYNIIAVFDNIKGNGGHSLELNITTDTERIIVNITPTSPEGNATTVITQPFHIVKIETSNLPIIFEF